MFEDFGLRAAQSTDIEAPTLFDLFSSRWSQFGDQRYADQHIGHRRTALPCSTRVLKPEVRGQYPASSCIRRVGFRLRVSADCTHVGFGNAIGIVAGSSPIVQNICLESGGASHIAV